MKLPRASRAPLLAALVSLAAPPAAAQIEVGEATIAELQEAMESGRATSVEIVEAYLARIQAYDANGPRLNAILRLNPRALDEARAADLERELRGPRGPLHGIPVVLKDNVDVLGMPTSAGSIALARLMPPDDAFQVKLLRDAGAVILGKTNMHELAGGITTRGSLGGQTLNPYDLTRNPGGSSGGTAVAVTASFAAVGWGTDACGSVRVPASQNNLVGLRPTKGLSSIDGVLTLSHTLDVAAPMARTFRDLAIALDATVGADANDPATAVLAGRAVPRFVDALDPFALRGARLGLLTSFFGTDPEDEPVAAVVSRALQEMRTLGASVVPVEIAGVDQIVARAIVMGDEFKWDMMDYLAGTPDAPVRSLSELLELGLLDEDLVPSLRQLDAPAGRTTPEYLRALAARDTLRAAVLRTMEQNDLDAVVYPTLLRIASHLDDPQLGSNCRLSSNTGLPALTVPVGFTPQGLPVGVELLGRPLDDALLVGLGYAYEQGADHRRPPPAAPPLVNGAPPPPTEFEVVATGAGFAPATGSPAEVRARFSVDPVMGRLDYAFETDGVEPAEVHGIVLRAMVARGQWAVVRRLSGLGRTAGSGSFTLDAALRDRLGRGELYLDLLTDDHPFGAARARVVAASPTDP